MVGVQLGIKYGIFIAISEIIQLNPVIVEHTYIIKREEKLCHYCQAHPKNDRNGGVWQSGISKSVAEYVQRPVCFINVQSSFHENVVFA